MEYQKVKIDELTRDDVAGICDYTFLATADGYKSDPRGAAIARDAAFEEFLANAREYRPFAVCVLPRDARRTAETLQGSGIRLASVLSDFPSPSRADYGMLREIEYLIDQGVREIDMVLDWSAIQQGSPEQASQTAQAIINRAHFSGTGALVKIIITSNLSQEQRRHACLMGRALEADMMKTSTGYENRGASVEDLLTMRKAFEGGLKISAGVGKANYRELLAAAAGDAEGNIILNPYKIRIGASKLLAEL